jgi:hypothetical protein
MSGESYHCRSFTLYQFPVAKFPTGPYYFRKAVVCGREPGARSMASGFNTEITHEGTVYHVQTEPRKEGGIETAVYVKGAVIHSLKTSHHELVKASQDCEGKLSELVVDQHRRVIAQIRAGELRFPPLPSPNAERV